MGKVLLIDDDAFFLKVHADALGALGYQLVSFESPVDALAAEWHEIAAVVCDLQMPQMTGTELLTAVRESGATQAPFLFLTAQEPSEELLAAAVKYSADYLPKSAGPGELASWLASKLPR